MLAIYQQTVLHGGGPLDCLRKPNNVGSWDSDGDGVVDSPMSCDNCRMGMFGGFPGSEWNAWQEDYNQDGVGRIHDADCGGVWLRRFSRLHFRQSPNHPMELLLIEQLHADSRVKRAMWLMSIGTESEQAADGTGLAEELWRMYRQRFSIEH